MTRKGKEGRKEVTKCEENATLTMFKTTPPSPLLCETPVILFVMQTKSRQDIFFQPTNLRSLDFWLSGNVADCHVVDNCCSVQGH